MRGSRINPSNLFTMSVRDVIDTMSERVLGDIPEGVLEDNDMMQVEIALGRLANDYAYVITLLSYSRNYVRQLKRAKEKERYEDMMDIRDGLESISSAIKLQYQAVSRMLTVKQQEGYEQDMYEYRKKG